MTPQRVERSYLIMTGLYNMSASLIWGVNTLFLMNAGLDIFEVFITNGIFTASMAIFEIPTGVLADTRGRRASFLLSVVVILVGTVGYVMVAEMGGGLFWFNVMSVVLGLGYTFYSGAVDAWLVDALTETGFTGELDHVFARGGMVFGAAMLVGTLGGGFLGTMNLSLPYVVRAVLLLGVFVVAWKGMHDIGYTPRTANWRELPSEMKKIASASLTYGWKVPSVKLLMVMGLVQASFMSWGFHSWQPYFLGMLEDKGAVWMAGVIAALVALSTMIGNGMVGSLGHWFHRRSSMLMAAGVVLAVGTILVGLADNFYLAVGLYLLVGMAFGAIGPVKQAYLHKMIPSEQRATIVSFDSLVGNTGAVGGQVGLGWLARQQSIGVGYITGGIFSLLVIPVLLLLRRKGHEADRMGRAEHEDHDHEQDHSNS